MSYQFKKVKIIYASASGNTLAVAEKVQEILLNNDFNVELIRAEFFDNNYGKNILYLFAVSTWEHGEINPFFNEIISFASKNSFKDIKVCFVGLGDLRYEKVLFCGGMNKLRDLLIEKQAKEIVSPIRINGEPYDKLDTLVANWAEKLVGIIENA